MIQLSKALQRGKVEIMMDPNHVGELHLNFPTFDPSGRVVGKSEVTLTGGQRISLLETFEVRQVENCEDLRLALNEGRIVIL